MLVTEQELKAAVDSENIKEIERVLQFDLMTEIEGCSLLIYAAKNNKLITTEILLQQDELSIDATDGNGMTALHWASSLDSSPIVASLIKAGANKEAVTKIQKQTPLHLAILNNKLVTAQVLLRLGASTTALDYQEKTPLEYAEIDSALYLLFKNNNPPIKNRSEHLTYFFFDAIARGIKDGRMKGRQMIEEPGFLATTAEAVGGIIGFFPGLAKGIGKTQRDTVEPDVIKQCLDNLAAFPDHSKDATIKAINASLLEEIKNDPCSETLVKHLNNREIAVHQKWQSIINYIKEGQIDRPTGEKLILSDGKYAYRNNGKSLFCNIVKIVSNYSADQKIYHDDEENDYVPNKFEDSILISEEESSSSANSPL